MLRPLVLAAAILVAAQSAQAAETPTLESCATAYGACVDTCGATQESEAARAGCVARCAAQRATCEAEAGYEQAKPWVREQMDKLEDFLRGFRDGPAPEAPETKSGNGGGYKDL